MNKYAFNLGMPKLRLPHKLLLIMKLVIIILFTSLMQVSATSFAQYVTLKEKNAPLESVISKIRSQTGYDFVFDFRLLEKSKRVSVNLNNENLESALKIVFKDQDLDFTIKDKIIVIKAREISFMDQLEARVKSALAFNQNVNGTVSDTLGNKLIGASVSLRGAKSYNATSDNTGRFEFPSIPEGNYKISVTYVGYKKLEETVNVRQGMNSLLYILKQGTSDLDQVQVIAYGTTTKRFNVGAVTTVTAADIEKHPVSNVLLALQGQVPGMALTTSSGAPGAAVRVQIRGQNTLRNGDSGISPYDQPLFIVDGIPMAAQNNNINTLPGFLSPGTENSTGLSPFSTINPSDIESVTVLKDADATSIYGSQGANGVVLITTKKGKAGKPQLSLSMRTGIDMSTSTVTMLNTQQYRAMRLEAFANDGININDLQGTNPFSSTTYAPDLTVFDQNKNTDWYNYLLRNNPINTNVHSSFSGGSNNMNFIVSGGLNRQGYNFPGNLSNSVYTFHSGFNYNSPDGKLAVGIISDLAYQDNQASSAASVVRNILTPPNYPDLLDAQGRLVWDYRGVSLDDFQTLGKLNKVDRTQSTNMNNSIAISYEFFRNFKANVNVGYNRNNTSELQQDPLSSQSPTSGRSSAGFGNNNSQTINIEPQLNYKNRIGKGDLSVLIGGTYKKNVQDRSTILGNDYANDALLGSVAGAASVLVIPDDGRIYKYTGVFGRIGYIWDQKYIASVTGRRDGSSNFGPSKKFGNFGSAGLGWIFSEEKPVKNFLSFLSYGKLSASFGTTGTDAVDPYRYQTFWEAADFGALFQGTRPYQPANLYNPNYSWDLKKTLNTSIDLGFLNDRILLNATWYQSRIGNQLINARLPAQTGKSVVIENSPATLQNRGLEFTLSTTNIKTPNFKWTTNFNISGNRNKLLAFPDLANSAYFGEYEIGKPITTKPAFRYKGVNPQTGLFEFYTKNGGTTSDPGQNDRELLVDITPEFFGGLGNTMTYKNFSLSFLFQFSKGMTTNWLATLYTQSAIPGQMSNLPVQALSRWQKPGDISELQKFTTNPVAQYDGPALKFVGSTGAYTESTYARLKMASLSYSLPSGLLKKIGVKGLQVYVNAENLFVISNFEVGDPESVTSLFTQPLQRTIVGGLSINL
ncbi:SusC/RagA family TonB-linked outer membrane protein [Pedobacter miscanthi]|uniref:SusC/RagA family TonB-linked outer membrane protein n=1 Tax=Pedobacter miscanthi TaxID=2259170 RepID=UPI00292D9C9A|nr:SusC/RagA family TonB-linked outer membrane protein [Pedobacter miscanthi]